MKQSWVARRPIKVARHMLFIGDPVPDVTPKELARMHRAGAIDRVLVFEAPSEFEEWREQGLATARKRLTDARRARRSMRARAFAPPNTEPEPEPEPIPATEPEPERTTLDLDL